MRLAYQRTEWKMCVMGLGASFACVLLVACYGNLNAMHNGFTGISTVTNENELDVVIQMDIYKNGSDKEIIALIDKDLTVYGKALYNFKIRNDLCSNFKRDRISKYLTSCITNEPLSYAAGLFHKMLLLSSQGTSAIYAKVSSSNAGLFFSTFSNLLSVPFAWLYVFLILDFAFILYVCTRTKRLPWGKAIIWLIVAAHLLVTLAGAQNEYNRLFVPAQPLVLLAVLWYADLLSCAIDRSIFKEFIFALRP